MGEILYKIWQVVFDQDDKRPTIEAVVRFWAERCFNSTEKFAEKARSMLHTFFVNKNGEKESDLLEKTMTPLLWKHLRVYNTEVRANAIDMLKITFPLNCSE